MNQFEGRLQDSSAQVKSAVASITQEFQTKDAESRVLQQIQYIQDEIAQLQTENQAASDDFGKQNDLFKNLYRN